MRPSILRSSIQVWQKNSGRGTEQGQTWLDRLAIDVVRTKQRSKITVWTIRMTNCSQIVNIYEKHGSRKRPEPHRLLSSTETWTENRPEEHTRGTAQAHCSHSGRESEEERLRDPDPNIWSEAPTAKGAREVPGWPMDRGAWVKRGDEEEKPGRRERHRIWSCLSSKKANKRTSPLNVLSSVWASVLRFFISYRVNIITPSPYNLWCAPVGDIAEFLPASHEDFT